MHPPELGLGGHRRITVRMPLHGQATIRPLDFIERCLAAHAKNGEGIVATTHGIVTVRASAARRVKGQDRRQRIRQQRRILRDPATVTV